MARGAPSGGPEGQGKVRLRHGRHRFCEMNTPLLTGQALIPAQCLRDCLVVDTEVLGDLVEAQAEGAESLDITSNALAGRRFRLG